MVSLLHELAIGIQLRSIAKKLCPHFKFTENYKDVYNSNRIPPLLIIYNYRHKRDSYMP